MTTEEWVAAKLSDAPRLAPEQSNRISLLLAGASRNVEAAARSSEVLVGGVRSRA